MQTVACRRTGSHRRHPAGSVHDVDRVRPTVGIAHQSGAEARGHLHVSSAGAARARALDDGDACGGLSHSCIASDDQRLVRWDASASRWRLVRVRDSSRTGSTNIADRLEDTTATPDAFDHALAQLEHVSRYDDSLFLPLSRRIASLTAPLDEEVRSALYDPLNLRKARSNFRRRIPPARASDVIVSTTLFATWKGRHRNGPVRCPIANGIRHR